MTAILVMRDRVRAASLNIPFGGTSYKAPKTANAMGEETMVGVQDGLVSVVLPVYKTEQFLPELVERLRQTLEEFKAPFELLLIDDGSPDEAWQTIQELAAEDTRVKGIRFSKNFGQQSAIAVGFEKAQGEFIVLMDTDLQDRPEELPLLLNPLKEGAELALTVKSSGSGLSSRIYHWAIARATGTSVPPHVGTYRAFTRNVLEGVLQYRERNVIYGSLMHQMGYETVEVPVQHDPRESGKSSYGFRRRLALAYRSIVYYTDLPQRLVLNSGVAITLGCLVYLVILILRYLFASVELPPGLTLLALLITFSLGCIMTALGVMGAYVFRIFEEVLDRPRYLIAQTKNMEGNTDEL